MLTKNVPLKRFWLPEGTKEPIESSGFLVDPLGEHGHLSNPAACSLEELAKQELLVLLGEPGMGKTATLEYEISRMRNTGALVDSLDLADFDSRQDLRQAFRCSKVIENWKADTVGDLTLFLDSFDEVTFSKQALVAGLVQEVSTMDCSRLRLRIASRPGAWSNRLATQLGKLFKTTCPVWVLTPLTAGDATSIATATLPNDGEQFVGRVIERDIGSLASRPVTLNLLLSVFAKNGKLPTSRPRLYEDGIGTLLAESNERRKEADTSPIPIDAVMAAAEHLGAMTLLCGRSVIIRRQLPAGTSDRSLNLDDPAMLVRELGALDVVFDSALTSSNTENQGAWSHRTFGEYLAAKRLSALPDETVRHLLADPYDTAQIAARFEGIAVWLSQMNEDVLDWLIETQPEMLLTADLLNRTEADRRLIGRALIERVSLGIAPREWCFYRGLDYSELAEDLRSLIAPDQLMRVRLSAITIASHNSIRNLDDELIGFVTDVGELGQDAATGEMEELGWRSAFALEGCTDPEIQEQLWTIAMDSSVPWRLRANVLYPIEAHVDPDRLLDALSDEIWANERSGFSSTVIRILESAAEKQPSFGFHIVKWLTDNETWAVSEEWEDPVLRMISQVTNGAQEPRAETWIHLASLCGTFMSGQLGFSHPREQNLFENAERRQRLVQEIISNASTPVCPQELINLGLLLHEDFTHWMTVLSGLLEQESDDRDPIEDIVWSLARPDEENKSLAAALLDEHPALFDHVEAMFSAKRLNQRAREQEKKKEKEEAAVEELFSVKRAELGIEKESWRDLAPELQRSTTLNAGLVSSSIEVSDNSAWSKLETEQKKDVVKIAFQFLSTPQGIEDWSDDDAAVQALTLLSQVDPSRIDDLEVEVLKTWLPRLLTIAGAFKHCGLLLTAVAKDDAEWVERLIIDGLKNEADDQFPFIVRHAESHPSAAIGKVVLNLASEPQTHVDAVHKYLSAALVCQPAEATKLAMELIRARPSSRMIVVPIGDLDVGATEPKEVINSEWRRSVRAASALVYSEALMQLFDDVLDQFKSSTSFAQDVIRFFEPSAYPRTPFGALAPEQLGELYQWAHTSLPPTVKGASSARPLADHSEDFADRILGRLRHEPTADDVKALDKIASELRTADDDFAERIEAMARKAAQEMREKAWVASTPSEIGELLDKPAQRIVNSAEQLADALVEAIDRIGSQIKEDPVLLSTFWHRQKENGQWIPAIENEFSDRFARQLRSELNDLVIQREVQYRPRLADQAGQIPDLVVTAVRDDNTKFSCLVEVKRNLHDEVKTALMSQLVGRYLRGSPGVSGIYLVAWYAGDAAEDLGTRGKKELADVDTHLKDECKSALDQGFSVRYRMVDLTMNQADVPLTSTEQFQLSGWRSGDLNDNNKSR